MFHNFYYYYILHTYIHTTYIHEASHIYIHTKTYYCYFLKSFLFSFLLSTGIDEELNNFRVVITSDAGCPLLLCTIERRVVPVIFFVQVNVGLLEKETDNFDMSFDAGTMLVTNVMY